MTDNITSFTQCIGLRSACDPQTVGGHVKHLCDGNILARNDYGYKSLECLTFTRRGVVLPWGHVDKRRLT